MSYPIVVLGTPGLLGYWRLGDSDGSTTIRDRTPNARHGFTWGLAGIDQPGALPGDRDGSATFGGKVSVAYNAALNTQEWSCEVFAYPFAVDGQYHTVVMNRDSALGRGWNIYLGDNNRWQAWMGPGWVVADSGVTAEPNRWTHIVATYDGSRLSIWIDGEIRNTVLGTMVVNATQPMTFGQTYEDSLGFNGRLDEVSVYNRALTPEEITLHYEEANKGDDAFVAAAVAKKEAARLPAEFLPVGPITMSVECYRVDISCKPIEDLSDYFVTGWVDWHEEREGGSMMGGEVVLRLDEPNKVRLLSDYIAFWVTLEYGDGRRVRKQVGQFAPQIPRERHNRWSGTATYPLMDMTTLLDQAAFSAPVTYPAGNVFTTRLEDLIGLAGAGLRHDVRASAQTMGFGRTWWPGRTVRYACGRLTQAIGYYQPFMEMDGRLVTLPLRDFREIAPAVTFWGNEYEGEIEIEPSGDPLANVVQVISDDPSKDTIFWEEANTDPSSPTAIQNITPPREIVRVIQDNEIETLAAAKARARAELNRLGSYYRTVRIKTLPDLDPGIYRTADVRFRTTRLRPQGRYYIRGWRVGLQHNDALTSYELGRLFDFPEDA
jgi:hypothetical protein